MSKTVELMMVDPSNKNKFYRMIDTEDGQFRVEYGRVGADARIEHYPISKWNTKYKEKIRKGYKDITHLKIEDETQEMFIEEKNDNPGITILKTLQNYASSAIKTNYTISSQAVTTAQIAEAQNYIISIGRIVNAKNIKDRKDIDTINDNLIKLYTVIPRKMKKVQNHIASDLNSARHILSDEQDLLDVMKQQVEMYLASKKINSTVEKQDLASMLGISISLVEDNKTIDKISKMCHKDADKIINIYDIINFDTQKRFHEYLPKAFDATTKLLFHGSRNQNWLNILKTGLLIRPAGVQLTGSMFGNGLYFADKAIKSIGYTSLSGSYWARGSDSKGFIALYSVNTGKELQYKKHEYWMSNLDRKALLKHGNYDCFFAEGGIDLRNNEYIVYLSEQCTIKYLIELKG